MNMKICAFEAAFQANSGEIVYSSAYTVGDTSFTALLTDRSSSTKLWHPKA